MAGWQERHRLVPGQAVVGSLSYTAMNASRTLFWHRRDLRLADNKGLQAAAALGPAVTGVYVLDPATITPPHHLPPMAPARLWFLVETLRELQQRWRDAGSRLIVVAGDPVAVLLKDPTTAWPGTKR